MNFETIKYSVEDGVATITLARPEKRNAISHKMAVEIGKALELADEDDSVRVVVLTGEGEKAFCAGGDLNPQEEAGLSLVQRYERARAFPKIFKLMFYHSKPIVGKINGDAFGGGFGLASACDITVAVEEARFGTPEINIGLFPYVILAVLWRTATNRKKLLELMLTGERISAREAQELGFVNYVVPRAELDSKVAEIVGKLKDKSPAILRMGKRAFYVAREIDFDRSLEFLVSMLSVNTMAEDLIEGVMAFFQKRKPEWKGK